MLTEAKHLNTSHPQMNRRWTCPLWWVRSGKVGGWRKEMITQRKKKNLQPQKKHRTKKHFLFFPLSIFASRDSSFLFNGMFRRLSQGRPLQIHRICKNPFTQEFVSYQRRLVFYQKWNPTEFGLHRSFMFNCLIVWRPLGAVVIESPVHHRAGVFVFQYLLLYSFSLILERLFLLFHIF